ncbi:hypothetical protein [Psychrobacter sp. K31L]|uniref:hypothetical protein n=1 Tax=Psychrobacter sp. K31L TaxID=2820758 RepID=UPI001B34555B|nr:hypothetical protein [Psychrobacter sp. K31L]MBP3947041.1 hypothetical protein [Psychrobacter sp. K31L]
MKLNLSKPTESFRVIVISLLLLIVASSAFALDRKFYLEIDPSGGQGFDEDKPQVLIRGDNNFKCSNTSLSMFYYGEHCQVKERPVPESVTIEYGQWISAEESERLYPAMPGFRPKQSEETEAAYRVKVDAHYERLSNLPEYQKIATDEEASKANIEWHTYTIYPEQLMKKYKYKIPEGGDTSSYLNPLDWSTKLWVTIVIHPDMTITLDESYSFASGTVSWH